MTKTLKFQNSYQNLQAHGLTLSCPEVYMGLHDTLATAIQVQHADGKYDPAYRWKFDEKD